MSASTSHLLLLPSYNTGAERLGAVVKEALAHWQPVLVVIDGSDDGSAEALLALAREMSGRAPPPPRGSAGEGTRPPLSVLVLPRNSGKGAAVLAGARWAQDRGFTHVLTMDADGQHVAAHIARFMEISRANPGALVLGKPIFPANIPRERLHGRKISVVLVRCAILGRGIDDPLFGFRVYPVAPLLDALGARSTGRRYDFDAEAAVRLCWAGVQPLNVPAPVRYFSRAEGGISHFHYVRDNVTLARMHTRLVFEMLLRRAPEILRHRRRWREAAIAPELTAETVR